MNYQPHTSRDLLLDLGVGRFNATMLVETMMMAPAVTEAASSPVMLLVQHIQLVLQDVAPDAGVKATGIVDDATDAVMQRIAGTNWLSRTWFDVTRMVVAFKRSGRTFGYRNQTTTPKSMGFLDLPDVPGGMLTYGIGAFLVYRALKKRRS